jgi:hypothetical protein
VRQYLPTGKLGLEKHILWLESSKFFQEKYTNKMKDKVLFQEPFNSFGVKLNKEKQATLSKQVLHKFITNR